MEDPVTFFDNRIESRTDNKITQPSHHGTYESAMMQKICENVYQIERFLNLFSSC